MVIDDDKDELSFFLDALREINDEDGFKCTYADSSAHALDILKHLTPDYIFVDFNMPKVNGLEFLDLIHHEQRLKNTRAYLYSVHIDEQTTAKAIGSGAQGCLKKTTTIQSLSTSLSNIFSKQLPA